MFQVLVDGEVRVKPVKLTGAKSYKNAEVYLGDMYYPAAGAKVKNLILGDCDNSVHHIHDGIVLN